MVNIKKEVEQTLKDIGDECRKVRVQKGWTQNKLAKETGIKQQYISRFEEGLPNCRIMTIFRIFYAMGKLVEFKLIPRKEK